MRMGRGGDGSGGGGRGAGRVRWGGGERGGGLGGGGLGPAFAGGGCGMLDSSMGRHRPPLRLCISAHRNTTGVPLSNLCASVCASQFVRRTQPCEVAVPIVSGAFVPWIP